MKIIILLLLCSPFASAWQEFHGGDEDALKFHSFLNQTLQYFQEIPALNVYYHEVSIIQNSRAVHVVLTSEALFMNNQPKVAIVKKTMKGPCATINTCELVVDLKTWLKLDDDQKLLLMLHEIANLGFLADDDYVRSSIYYRSIIHFKKYANTQDELLQKISAEFRQCKLGLYADVSHLVVEKFFARKLIENLKNDTLCPNVRQLIQILSNFGD